MTLITPFAAVAVLAFAVPAAAQAPAPPPALKTTEVKPGLFMITGDGGAVAVRVAPAGLLVVDSKNPGDAIFARLTAAIRAISPEPVKFVVDTHHHADHTGNNRRFADAGAVVVGNEGVKPGLAAYRQAAANPENARLVDPSITFTDQMAIDLGGPRAVLLHYGPGHTRGDTFVYFPELKALATGDEVVGGSPTFDYPGGGEIAGWLAALDQVLKLDFDVAIPGHGDRPLSKAEVQAFRQKLATFLARAKAEVKAGTPKQQLIAKIRIDDLGWRFAPEFWTAVPGRLDGLYAEASK
jgi:glyoxylase-like metal-dependent hydrolase (beta-lactamase superfamily II)